MNLFTHVEDMYKVVSILYIFTFLLPYLKVLAKIIQISFHIL